MPIEKFIPVVEERNPGDEMPAESVGCAAKEPYVLMVLGDSMLPEFSEGEVIVIEPGRAPQDGSFVVAMHNGEHTFRQFVQIDGRWHLKALNEAYPAEPVSGPEVVQGVIIQKQGRGGRRDRKFYG